MQVLIAEPEQALGRFLQQGMEAEGFAAKLACDGEQVLAQVEEISPDLIILDLNLPKKDGMEVLRALRARHQELRSLVLTSRSDMDTRITCLDLGADDFMSKPFSIRELRARCRALLRRLDNQEPPVLRFQNIELNRLERTVRRDDQPVFLTKREFALFECLMLRRGTAVPRGVLVDRVWKESSAINASVVDVYVNYLRRKLEGGRNGSLIQTVRGVGYRVAAETNQPPLQNTRATENGGSLEPWRNHGNSFGAQQAICRVAGQC